MPSVKIESPITLENAEIGQDQASAEALHSIQSSDQRFQTLALIAKKVSAGNTDEALQLLAASSAREDFDQSPESFKDDETKLERYQFHLDNLSRNAEKNLSAAVTAFETARRMGGSAYMLHDEQRNAVLAGQPWQLDTRQAKLEVARQSSSPLNAAALLDAPDPEDIWKEAIQESVRSSPGAKLEDLRAQATEFFSDKLKRYGLSSDDVKEYFNLRKSNWQPPQPDVGITMKVLGATNAPFRAAGSILNAPIAGMQEATKNIPTDFNALEHPGVVGKTGQFLENSADQIQRWADEAGNTLQSGMANFMHSIQSGTFAAKPELYPQDASMSLQARLEQPINESTKVLSAGMGNVPKQAAKWVLNPIPRLVGGALKVASSGQFEGVPIGAGLKSLVTSVGNPVQAIKNVGTSLVSSGGYDDPTSQTAAAARAAKKIWTDAVLQSAKELPGANEEDLRKLAAHYYTIGVERDPMGWAIKDPPAGQAVFETVAGFGLPVGEVVGVAGKLIGGSVKLAGKGILEGASLAEKLHLAAPNATERLAGNAQGVSDFAKTMFSRKQAGELDLGRMGNIGQPSPYVTGPLMTGETAAAVMDPAAQKGLIAGHQVRAELQPVVNKMHSVGFQKLDEAEKGVAYRVLTGTATAEDAHFLREATPRSARRISTVVKAGQEIEPKHLALMQQNPELWQTFGTLKRAPNEAEIAARSGHAGQIQEWAASAEDKAKIKMEEAGQADLLKNMPADRAIGTQRYDDLANLIGRGRLVSVPQLWNTLQDTSTLVEKYGKHNVQRQFSRLPVTGQDKILAKATQVESASYIQEFGQKILSGELTPEDITTLGKLHGDTYDSVMKVADSARQREEMLARLSSGSVSTADTNTFFSLPTSEQTKLLSAAKQIEKSTTLQARAQEAYANIGRPAYDRGVLLPGTIRPYEPAPGGTFVPLRKKIEIPQEEALATGNLKAGPVENRPMASAALKRTSGAEEGIPDVELQWQKETADLSRATEQATKIRATALSWLGGGVIHPVDTTVQTTEQIVLKSQQLAAASGEKHVLFSKLVADTMSVPQGRSAADDLASIIYRSDAVKKGQMDFLVPEKGVGTFLRDSLSFQGYTPGKREGLESALAKARNAAEAYGKVSNYILKPINSLASAGSSVLGGLQFTVNNAAFLAQLPELMGGFKGYKTTLPSLMAELQAVALGADVDLKLPILSKIFTAPNGEKTTAKVMRDWLVDAGLINRTATAYLWNQAGRGLPSKLTQPFQWYSKHVTPMWIPNEIPGVGKILPEALTQQALNRSMENAQKLMVALHFYEGSAPHQLDRLYALVSKYAGNYDAMGEFEKTFMRDAVMFYPWHRYILPLLGKQLVTHPERFAPWIRAREYMQREYGRYQPATKEGYQGYLQSLAAIPAQSWLQPKKGHVGHQFAMLVIEDPVKMLSSYASLMEHYVTGTGGSKETFGRYLQWVPTMAIEMATMKDLETNQDIDPVAWDYADIARGLGFEKGKSLDSAAWAVEQMMKFKPTQRMTRQISNIKTLAWDNRHTPTVLLSLTMREKSARSASIMSYLMNGLQNIHAESEDRPELGGERFPIAPPGASIYYGSEEENVSRPKRKAVSAGEAEFWKNQVKR